MNRRAVLYVALIVAVGNAVPLGTVVWDRTGAPRSVTEFSVRELAWSYTDNENTGISLGWAWNRASIDSASDALLDSLRLVCRPIAYGSSCHNSRRGYAVIGIDPAEWSADSLRRVWRLDSLRRAGSDDTTYLVRELRGIGRESRLVVLAVALDRAGLDAKWGSTWPILPVELSNWWYAESGSASRTRNLSVHVVPGKLYLPSALRGMVRNAPEYRYNDSVPESFATVTVGRAGLPRITAVRWSAPTAP